MTTDELTILVQNAKNGCNNSLNRIATDIRPQLEQYIFRLTLDRQLTQDVTQEALTTMVKALGKLDKPDRFWPFIRKIAFHKARDAQKAEIRRREVHGQLTPPTDIADSPIADQISRELKDIVVQSMQSLDPDHRQVLTLRCYEDMDYTDIADIMDRSPFAARMLFVRAKKSLQKQLARNGLHKATLLTTLVVFGKVTATSEAAATTTVTAASLQAGTAAGFLAAVTTKIAAMLLIGAAVIGGGLTIKAIFQDDPREQAQLLAQTAQPINIDFYHSASLEPLETWIHFPAGLQGPVYRRLTTRHQDSKDAFCRYVYDGQTCRYYDPKTNTAYAVNCNPFQADLSITRLPGDSWELTRQLDDIEGRATVLPARVTNTAGLWCIANHKADAPEKIWDISQRSNLPLEDCFRHPWPMDVQEEDSRDDAHKRGWTFFTISGEIKSQKIAGRGLLPLNAAISPYKKPWIELNVSGVPVEDADFTGLGRPWTGLHTIDTIRRDAAQCGYVYTTQLQTNQTRVNIEVATFDIKLIYTVDLFNDILESIDITNAAGQPLGRLEFTYPETIENPDYFTPSSDSYTPSRPKSKTSSPQSTLELWLVNLVSEN